MTVGFNAFALGIALLGASGGAAPDVGLDVDPCLGLPEAEVRRLTELELAMHVVSAATDARLAASVRVTCLDDQALIRVTDVSTNAALERTLEFTSSALDVRARALALATAELLLAHWAELARAAPAKAAAPSALNATAAPPTEKDTAGPVVDSRLERRHSPHVEYVLAFAQASSTFGFSDVGWGGGLRLGWVSGLSWLGADFELSATRGGSETSLGPVHSTIWSFAARPTLRLAERPLFAGIGIGARVGYAHVEGSPNDPEKVRGRVIAGSWGGPLAHAELGLELNHFFGCAGVEAGYALKTVRGSVDGKAEAGISGAFGSATLGLGWRF